MKPERAPLMARYISTGDLNKIKELMNNGVHINEASFELGITWISWSEAGSNEGEYQYRKYDYTKEMGSFYYCNVFEGWRGCKFTKNDANFEFSEKRGTGSNRKYGFGIPWTPLQYAACQGNVEIVGYLLSMGANPLVKDSSGMTAADIASKLEHHTCEAILLRASSNVVISPLPRVFYRKYCDLQFKGKDGVSNANQHIIGCLPMLKDTNFLNEFPVASIDRLIHLIYTGECRDLKTMDLISLSEIATKLGFPCLELMISEMAQDRVKNTTNKDELELLKQVSHKQSPGGMVSKFKKEIETFISSLYHSGNFSNVVIKSREGSVFRLHKQIVCSLPYMDTMFQNLPGRDVYELREFSYKSLKFMFDLAYLGEGILDDDFLNVREVYILAKLNHMEDVAKNCIFKFQQNLNMGNLYKTIAFCFESGVIGDLPESCLKLVYVLNDLDLIKNIYMLAKKVGVKTFEDVCIGKFICKSGRENAIQILMFCLANGIDTTKLMYKLEHDLGKFDAEILKLYIVEHNKVRELENALMMERRIRKDYEAKNEERMKRLEDMISKMALK